MRRTAFTRIYLHIRVHNIRYCCCSHWSLREPFCWLRFSKQTFCKGKDTRGAREGTPYIGEGERQGWPTEGGSGEEEDNGKEEGIGEGGGG